MRHTDFPDYLYNKYQTANFYLISLEAWRRGLTVTFTGDIKNYTISSPTTTHKFSKSLALDPDIGFRTHEICENKDETKKCLSEAQVPVPKGRRFPPDMPDEEILSFASEIGYPVVLKPTSGYKGKGVYSNIEHADSLKSLLRHVRRELKYPDVMLEQHISGDDFRIFVIGDDVVAALKRVPAHVTGNGRVSIKKLISDKNIRRAKNPNLLLKLINIDREVLDNIRRAGYKMNSLLPEGELLFLRKKCNIGYGGDSIDVTETLPKHVKDTAVQAVKAIPGLNNAGVDVLYDETSANSPGVVIEINSMAEIGGHLYPVHGEPRDIPSAIIDHYFPDSTENRERNRSVFYDVDRIKRTLEKDPETDITLTPVPGHEMSGRQLVISGKVQGVGFRRWAKKQAQQLDLSGFAENAGRDSVRVVVAGEEKNVNRFEQMCASGPDNARVETVDASSYPHPIVLGFRIIRKVNPVRVKTAHFLQAVRGRLSKLKRRLF